MSSYPQEHVSAISGYISSSQHVFIEGDHVADVALRRQAVMISCDRCNCVPLHLFRSLEPSRSITLQDLNFTLAGHGRFSNSVSSSVSLWNHGCSFPTQRLSVISKGDFLH